MIPLNYFPSSLALSDEEKFIAVGTKEGLLLFITRGEENYHSCFNLDLFKGHYDSVDTIEFSHDTKKVFSKSKNELFVWDILLNKKIRFLNEFKYIYYLYFYYYTDMVFY